MSSRAGNRGATVELGLGWERLAGSGRAGGRRSNRSTLPECCVHSRTDMPTPSINACEEGNAASKANYSAPMQSFCIETFFAVLHSPGALISLQEETTWPPFNPNACPTTVPEPALWRKGPEAGRPEVGEALWGDSSPSSLPLSRVDIYI